jgi:dihydroorotate dehydrogenase (NAD+) catalytic subunit
MAEVADLSVYGAAVAKSVSVEPWAGKPPPRLAPAGTGMLNGIGIQNPGIARWRQEVAPHLPSLGVPVWGSAVGHGPEDFAEVAAGLESAGVAAVEINLSCPNLEGHLIALDPAESAKVVEAVRSAVRIPIGAKLSPNGADPVPVAAACAEAGADWVVLTNTIWGAAIDVDQRRPLLSGIIGGYSGPPLKPVALRCVIDVHRALPDLPIVGCGGVINGTDVVEYLMAGAAAVALGTVHFADPRAGRRILDELETWCRREGCDPAQIIGAAIR